ncbi:MAG: histidine kinase [Prolixibacteraceae bacterium]|nr:histidine kinase [Prolixibacteraceae bacterium]
MEKRVFIKPANQFFHRFISRPYLFHIALWLVVLIILSVLTGLNGVWPFYFYFLNMFVALPAMIFFTYTMEWFGQNLLFKKGRSIWLFIFIFLFMTISCSLLIPLLNHGLFFGLFFNRIFEPDPWFNWRLIPQNIILLWLPYFVLSIRTVLVYWFRSEQEKLLIENKRLLAEIKLMKIKLHPHFLFNTLNNLYAMSTVNCDKTPEYILKLSELFRIMLYECNKEFYPVSEEIGLIRNYIELEKIRYDDRLKLETIYPENIGRDLLMPPLLLFSFVENAFKHSSRHHAGVISISIVIQFEADNMIFRSSNSVSEIVPPKKGYGGFGLDNTQKRLELVYGKEYVFENGYVNNCYEVYLKIPNLYTS